MRKNYQLVVDKENGDCMRACLTSMLDIPNDPELAVGNDPKWFPKWWDFLKQFGLQLSYESKACWRNGYWMASVKSLNYPGECTHAIVMLGHEVAWDPSTGKRYEEGTSLLGEDVVLGGSFLEVTDASLLYKLVEYQKAHA